MLKWMLSGGFFGGFFEPFLDTNGGGGNGGGGGNNPGGGNPGGGNPGGGNNPGGGGNPPGGGSPGGGNPGGGHNPSEPAGTRTYTDDYVQALRGEAAGYRTQLRTFQQAVRQVLGLGETDALPSDPVAAVGGLRTQHQQQIEQATGKARNFYLQGMFAAAAAGKVASVDDAFKLADLSGVEVNLDTGEITVKGKDGKPLTGQDGKPLTGQAALGVLVDELLQAKPYLKAAGGGPAGAGGTAPAGGGSGEEKPEEIAKRMAEARKGGGQKKSFWG